MSDDVYSMHSFESNSLSPTKFSSESLSRVVSFQKAEKCRVDDESAEDDEEIFLTFINHLEASLSYKCCCSLEFSCCMCRFWFDINDEL